MLAARFPGILPPLSEAEALESAAVHCASSLGFDAALVGGGNPPRPGEISLAHHGVLFLDELPEFARRVLEALREPLESGAISLARAARQAQFPARFQLIAAMNPCGSFDVMSCNQDRNCLPRSRQTLGMTSSRYPRRGP